MNNSGDNNIFEFISKEIFTAWNVCYNHNEVNILNIDYNKFLNNQVTITADNKESFEYIKEKIYKAKIYFDKNYIKDYKGDITSNTIDSFIDKQHNFRYIKEYIFYSANNDYIITLEINNTSKDDFSVNIYLNNELIS
ncbi:hypothetical protein FPHOBKDP_00022 [Listeria phage LPJP1]|nr:hypothetical protein FPHOBKDP_00022 [Listeria phage LPJP1]